MCTIKILLFQYTVLLLLVHEMIEYIVLFIILSNFRTCNSFKNTRHSFQSDFHLKTRNVQIL